VKQHFEGGMKQVEFHAEGKQEGIGQGKGSLATIQNIGCATGSVLKLFDNHGWVIEHIGKAGQFLRILGALKKGDMFRFFGRHVPPEAMVGLILELLMERQIDVPCSFINLSTKLNDFQGIGFLHADTPPQGLTSLIIVSLNGKVLPTASFFN